MVANPSGPTMPGNYGGFGAEHQGGIYMGGLSGEVPTHPLDPDAWEAAAREKLSPAAYDYVAGGAGSERAVRENLAAFHRWRLVPRVLTNVEDRDLRIDLLGRTLPAPLILAPVGVLSIIHPDGELAVARAAASLQLPYVLSNAASHSLEEVARAGGAEPRWFQLYPSRDREMNASFVRRAEAAGYEALVVTLDTKILGWRQRDLKRAYLPFFTGQGIANYVSDPVFRSRLDEPPEKDLASAAVRYVGVALDPTFAWPDLEALIASTRLPVLLKGVLRAEDARRAVDAGAKGVIVSNHGGRQVDGCIPSLEALPDVVAAAGDKIPVLFDGGIRRGADAVIALALGARAVLVGRPYAWGLAVSGEEGVRSVLETLLAELDLTFALCGLSRASDIDRQLVSPLRGMPPT